MHKLTTDSAERIAPEFMQSLDELAREGARRMIAVALQLEVEEQISKWHDLRDEQGHALVVRNGRARERGLRAPLLAVGDGALGFWAALSFGGPTPRGTVWGCQ